MARNVLRQLAAGAIGLLSPLLASAAYAGGAEPGKHMSEATLVLPDLASVQFLGVNGKALLTGGLAVCALALVFGLVIYNQLKNMQVHRSMREISELIYETCKTYLTTQGKFIMLLWVFIAVIMTAYFMNAYGNPELNISSGERILRVGLILAFSLVGIGGSYFVAWFGIRVNTFANSRSAFASLTGKPFPTYAIPL